MIPEDLAFCEAFGKKSAQVIWLMCDTLEPVAICSSIPNHLPTTKTKTLKILIRLVFGEVSQDFE